MSTPVGDYDLRGRGLDGVFAQVRVTDEMIDADSRTRAQLGSEFPGWMLYRTIVSGTDIFIPDLLEWARDTGFMVARARKLSGRAVVSGKTAAKPGWVTRASWDALDRVIDGYFPEGLNARAARYGVKNTVYQRVRDTVAGGMLDGLELYQAVLHAEYLKIRREQKVNGVD